MQQVSDYELELMKIIWANSGTALYLLYAYMRKLSRC